MSQFKNIELEVKIYDAILKILGWKSFATSNKRYRALTIDGILPIIVNRKMLVKLQENVHVHEPTMITFRPYKNGRQCQFLVDKLMEEEEIEKVSIFREEENGRYKYSGIIIQKETGEVMLQEDECKTETEAKFRLFLSWYYGNKFDDDINLMISEEERFKRLKEEEKKKKEEESETTK